MAVRIQYDLQQLALTANDLYRYDKREQKGFVNNLLGRAATETMVSPPNGVLSFPSQEIRRAVELYAEQFCLFVEDTLRAFWRARAGAIGIGLPVWLQNSSNDYIATAVEGAMGEAVAGYLLERLFNARPFYRPRGRSPDMYMILPQGQGAIFEAKATININDDSLQSRLGEALAEMLTIWAYIDSVQSLDLLVAFCVGVSIGEDRIRSNILRLEFRP